MRPDGMPRPRHLFYELESIIRPLGTMASSATANETGGRAIDTILAAAGIALSSSAVISPPGIGALSAAHIPSLAQIIDPRSFVGLPSVPSPWEIDGKLLVWHRILPRTHLDRWGRI